MCYLKEHYYHCAQLKQHRVFIKVVDDDNFFALSEHGNLKNRRRDLFHEQKELAANIDFSRHGRLVLCIAFNDVCSFKGHVQVCTW